MFFRGKYNFCNVKLTSYPSGCKRWKDASDDIKDPYMSKLNKMLSNTESPGRKSLPHNSNDDKKVKSEKKLRTLRRRDKKMRQLKNYLDSYHKRDKYAGPNTNVGPVSLLDLPHKS